LVVAFLVANNGQGVGTVILNNHPVDLAAYAGRCVWQDKAHVVRKRQNQKLAAIHVRQFCGFRDSAHIGSMLGPYGEIGLGLLVIHISQKNTCRL